LDVLEDWVDAGLITTDQARAIRRHEAERAVRGGPVGATPPPEAGPSLVVEALGYLGGVVMLVGAGILVETYWTDVSVMPRAGCARCSRPSAPRPPPGSSASSVPRCWIGTTSTRSW
jgi:hypothetical protein